MTWVCQLNYFDPVQNAEMSAYFALGQGVSLPDMPWIAPGMTKWTSPSQKVTMDGTTGVVSTTTQNGEVDITDQPADVLSSGPFDSFLTKVFQGRDAWLFYVGNTWASRILMDHGMLGQPVAPISLGTNPQAMLAFTLLDPRSVLTGNIQNTLYGGTNVLPNGVDGLPSDIMGQPRPVLYGRASNIPGVFVNTSMLIYEMCDKQALIDCVRDGGVALTPGVQRANVASLQANSPAPGTYDFSNVATEGTYVRLGSTPINTMTFDVYEGETPALRTPAQIWSRLSVDRCGRTAAQLDPAAIATSDALDSGESGYWWSDVTDQQDALDTILSGYSGYEVEGAAGLWEIQKLIIPAAADTTVVDLVVLSQSSALSATNRNMISLTAVLQDYANNGCLPYQVTVNWGQNFTTMSPSNFNGAAIQRLVAKFAQQWRYATVTNLNLWNPTALTGPWRYASAFLMNSNYAVGPDGLSCPAASAEAQRLANMTGVLRGQWQTSFRAANGDRVLPGNVVSMTIAQYGLQAGAKFRVLQSALTVDVNGPIIALVIGLQRLPSDP